MDREALRNAAVRYGLLFLISVVLVLGFWFHGNFYALGLVPLAIIGGFATFLVLLALRALASGGIGPSRVRGTLSFTRETSERVLAGTQTIAVFPLATPVPPPGSSARAVVTATGQAVAVVKVRDVRRRLVGDVLEEEAARAGFSDLDAFRQAWSRGRPWDSKEIVTVVEFRREARS